MLGALPKFNEGGTSLMAGHRLLSHTEIASALTCQARHAFAYTGHLTQGHTLRRRSVPRVLSDGRAWGVAAARWNQGAHTLLGAVEAADAMRAELDGAELEMLERGVTLEPELRVEAEKNLLGIFAHYAETIEPLTGLTRLEHVVIAGIPSRTGRRSSSKYKLEARIDGWTEDEDGRPWLVEFKLRGRLSSMQILQSSPQLRWYAWALRASHGIEPVGVLVDERLNLAPGEARIVNATRKGEGIDGKTVSHATDQSITVDTYVQACERFDVEPNPDTLEALHRRVWHQRVPILFRDSELEEAGVELVSAAKLVRDLDSGELFPVRNATPMTCNKCAFKEICPNPSDELYIETLYERRVPKRLKEAA